MITIMPLRDCQYYIPKLAEIWINVLGKKWMPDLSHEYIEKLIREWIEKETLPMACVAMENDKPIALASLQKSCGIETDLTPWLGSLVVDEQYQGKGIGKLLVEAILQSARNLGYNRVYLFTFDKGLVNFYEKLGWHRLGVNEFMAKPVIIMEKVL